MAQEAYEEVEEEEEKDEGQVEVSLQSLIYCPSS
jgi:hypothetical protein